MAEIVGLTAAVIALVKTGKEVVGTLKNWTEEWQSAQEKINELVNTLERTRWTLSLLARLQEDQYDDQLERCLQSLKDLINLSEQPREKPQRIGKAQKFMKMMKRLRGPGIIAKQNKKVTNLTESLRKSLVDINHILIVKLYLKGPTSACPVLEKALCEDLLLSTLKVLAKETGADEVVEVELLIQKPDEKDFHIPEEEEEQIEDESEEEQVVEMAVGEETQDEFFSGDDDEDGWVDEDGERDARLGGIEVKSNTKVQFKMDALGSEMYFHLVAYTEDQPQPELLFPMDKLLDHKIRNERTFPHRLRYRQDPPSIKLTKPREREQELETITTLYLVFSPTPLVTAGGHGNSLVSLNLEQLREVYDHVKVKAFEFDIS